MPPASALKHHVYLIWGKLTQRKSSHEVLQQLLADYSGLSPSDLEIKKSSRGKPFLADESLGIKFNWSHSAGYFLFAASRSFDLGVDLEGLTARRSWQKISSRFFSAEENSKLAQFSHEDDARNEFFKTWVTKESIVKASGEGIDEHFAEKQISERFVTRVFQFSPELMGAVTCLHDQVDEWHVVRRDLE